LRDLIARRAYEIYEERGRGDGADVADWLRAEVEVKSLLLEARLHPVESRAKSADLVLLPLTQRVHEELLKLKVSATNLFWHPYFSN